VLTAWSVPASARAAAPDAPPDLLGAQAVALRLPQADGDQQRRPQRAARRQLDHLVGLAGGARDREQLGQLPVERGVELVGAGARLGRRVGLRGDQADHDGVRVDGGR
jgi:hypothetical protein